MFLFLYSPCQQYAFSLCPGSTKTPMCGGPNKLVQTSNNTVDIMFDGSAVTYESNLFSKDCGCSITNTLGRSITLTVSIIDIRMNSYFVQDNQLIANCTSALFSFDGFALKCVDSLNPFKDNFRYMNLSSTDTQKTVFVNAGQSTDFSLTDVHKLGDTDAPAMVWIRVTCKYDGGWIQLFQRLVW